MPTATELPLLEATAAMIENGYDAVEFVPQWHTWIERGDIILIFENADLGHQRVGLLITMPWEADKDLPPHAPDNRLIGLGWRYLLKYVVRSL